MPERANIDIKHEIYIVSSVRKPLTPPAIYAKIKIQFKMQKGFNMTNTEITKNENPIKPEKISDTLKIYQQKGVFSYGTDAVLLSAYAASFMKFSTARTLFDLCSGTGIIGLMLLDHFRDNGNLSVSAVEINKDAARLSEMSAGESDLSGKYKVYNMDLKNIRESFDGDIADFITVNPPYMTANCGLMCEDDYKTIARHEILCNLEDIFKAAFHLLKTGGNMFVVYRPDRLSTLFSAAKAARLEIKNMTYVHSKQTGESKLVLCKLQKGSKEGMKISRPFIMYESDGGYSTDYITVRDKGVMEIG